MSAKAKRITLRLTPEDAERLRAQAAEDGCTVSECVRARVLNRRPRPRRTATEAERAELARILAAVGQIGGHTNQLAYQANAGGTVDADAVDALRVELEEWRDALIEALPERP